MEDYHQIPFYETPTGPKYPNQAMLLRRLHELLHMPADPIRGGTGWCFIEDVEFDQTVAVLQRFMEQSLKLDLDLEWNLQFFPLTKVVQYLKQYVRLEELPDDQFLFKSSMYDYLDLCGFHAKADCAQCALSKAHRYSYILSRTFSEKFKIERVPGQHGPLDNFRVGYF